LVPEHEFNTIYGFARISIDYGEIL
jgi:hypothetical protein